MRKNELFGEFTIDHRESVSREPRKLFPQDCDWSCSIACIRSIESALSENVLTEEEIIEKYKLLPKAYYSKDIRDIGLLIDFDTIYGCDYNNPTLDFLLMLMEEGYYVMVESMINYAHWMVLLGYYPTHQADAGESKFLFYDPYFDDVRLIRVEEFDSMWIDGDYENTKVQRDFIAIRSREAAIKRQPKAKKVKRNHKNNTCDCPTCGVHFNSLYNGAYCQVCGQELDWSDDDNDN